MSNFSAWISDESVQFIWWLLKTVILPATVPLIAYKAFRAAQQKVRKAHLRDKVVVITGASSGIGEAIAHKLYNQGCRLVLVARRIDELNRVRDDLLSTQPDISTHVPMTLQLDITDMKAITDAVNKIFDVYGKIDILVNNAGTSYRGHVIDTDIDVYVKIMSINYFAQIAMTKAVLPHMVNRNSGHIIFTSSLQAKIVLPCRSAYGASKHALQAFADSLRSEVTKNSINVSLITPSYVKTSLSINALTSKGDKYGKMDKSQLKGVAPEVIADDVISAIVNETREIIRGPIHHRLLNYTRVLFPPLYFKVLSILAKSMSEDMKK